MRNSDISYFNVYLQIHSITYVFTKFGLKFIGYDQKNKVVSTEYPSKLNNLRSLKKSTNTLSTNVLFVLKEMFI